MTWSSELHPFSPSFLYAGMPGCISLLNPDVRLCGCCREKAPFVLIVETLAAEEQPLKDAEASTSSQGSPDDGEGSPRTTVRRQPSSQYADSVQSVLAGRLSSHAAAAPGPGSLQDADQQPGKSVHRRNDTASSRLPSPGSPPAASAAADARHPKADSRPARLDLTSRRSLSFSEAVSDAAGDTGPAMAETALARSSAERLSTDKPSPRQLGRSPPGKSAYHDDSFARCGLPREAACACEPVCVTEILM